MLLRIHNPALIPAMIAVVWGSVAACSRSDRADAGRDTTQTGVAVTPADTQTSPAATPPESAAANPGAETDVSGYRPMGQDTSSAQPVDTAVNAPPSDTDSPEMAGAVADTSPSQGHDTVSVGDSTHAGKPGERLEQAGAAQQANSVAATDTAAATEPVPSQDTVAYGYEPMARDTSVALAQGDTVGPVESDTAVVAGTDTAAIQAQVDTTAGDQTELAIEHQADSLTVVGDSSSVNDPGPRAKTDTVAQKADSLAEYHEADRVRPPEDSTETLGQVTTDQPNYDVEAIGDAEGEVVGAARVPSTGNIATGADAVALMTREGEPCRVEDSRDVQWDLAGSPATRNPCGSGTMTLPKVQTGEE